MEKAPASCRRFRTPSYTEKAPAGPASKRRASCRRYETPPEGTEDDRTIVVGPVTEAHARIAREAYRDFGKGSGHAAGLNFGDCFAYALAKATGEPILFKGDDFRRRDLTPFLA